MSAYALGEAADTVGQAGVPDQLIGALEKLAHIHGLASDLMYHHIGLFLGYEVMDRINIAGFDAGVVIWSSGREPVLQAQRVVVSLSLVLVTVPR